MSQEYLNLHHLMTLRLCLVHPIRTVSSHISMSAIRAVIAPRPLDDYSEMTAATVERFEKLDSVYRSFDRAISYPLPEAHTRHSVPVFGVR